jgi:hypothetical protein
MVLMFCLLMASGQGWRVQIAFVLQFSCELLIRFTMSYRLLSVSFKYNLPVSSSQHKGCGSERKSTNTIPASSDHIDHIGFFLAGYRGRPAKAKDTHLEAI